MDLSVKCIESITTVEDFTLFLTIMEKDFKNHKEEWNNTSLDAYFESISAWVLSMPEHMKKAEINWGFIAKLMYIGKIYE